MDDFRKEALIKKLAYYSTGSEIINITYGIGASTTVPSKSVPVKTAPSKAVIKPAVSTSALKIGQYAKTIFESLLTNGKLSSSMIANLMDKNYCRRELSVFYPVLVICSSGNFDSQRYYKNLILDKYLICSQWYEKNRVKIDDWLAANGL